MELVKIISDLRRERDVIDEAIASLELLARAHGKRRGRPPAFLSNKRESLTGAAGGSRTRKPFSAATKKKMAAAQKKRWAAFRKSKKDGGSGPQA
ncbi:MAG: hypothetical protein ABI811_07755 [Acidobacteriota bacterium]